MRKSVLNQIAKLLKSLDAEIFGMPAGTMQLVQARATRAQLIALLEASGYQLSVNYKLVKLQ